MMCFAAVTAGMLILGGAAAQAQDAPPTDPAPAVTEAATQAPPEVPPPPPPPGDWRTVAAENLLVIDTTKGRVLVELAPLAAPLHVERIRLLSRAGFYDGVAWHRVIDWFMAQTGDPLGTGEGQTWPPNSPSAAPPIRRSCPSLSRRARWLASWAPCRSRPSPTPPWP